MSPSRSASASESTDLTAIARPSLTVRCHHPSCHSPPIRTQLARARRFFFFLTGPQPAASRSETPTAARHARASRSAVARAQQRGARAATHLLAASLAVRPAGEHRTGAALPAGGPTSPPHPPPAAAAAAPARSRGGVRTPLAPARRTLRPGSSRSAAPALPVLSQLPPRAPPAAAARGGGCVPRAPARPACPRGSPRHARARARARASERDSCDRTAAARVFFRPVFARADSARFRAPVPTRPSLPRAPPPPFAEGFRELGNRSRLRLRFARARARAAARHRVVGERKEARGRRFDAV